MKRNTSASARPTLEDMPFAKLIQADREYSELRRAYQGQTRQQRRSAADWEYESACASDIFEQAIGERHFTDDRLGAWRGYVNALVIDPEHGPALMTVGAIEYQLGRVDEAMALLFQLPKLPHDDDLPEIIDKAGDFLIDQDDLQNAQQLYEAATRTHPDVAIYHIGLGYCAGEDGRFDEAAMHTRRAVELEPGNYRHLSDLGYALTQAKQYAEAEQVLHRAVELAPPDYDMARGNLQHLYEVRD